MTPRQRVLASAVVGGTVGALLMDIAQYGWASAFEAERSTEDQDEESEAITSVVALLTRLVPGVFRVANASATGHAIHYMFGIAFAAAYLAALPNRRPTVVRGATFGVSLWLLSDRILIPAFKLGRPWSRYSKSERLNALVSHLAYALAVEFSRPR